MTYINQLEKYFHKDFLAMDVNTESKRYDITSYVEMLEEMIAKRGIKVDKQNYSKKELAIMIDDKKGYENKWLVYDETPTYFSVRHLDAITSVAKTEVASGKYVRKVNIPKGSTRKSLTYLRETGNLQIEENDLWEILKDGTTTTSKM